MTTNTEWQDSFTRYTTGFAFTLTLSRDQASLLEAIGVDANAAVQDWVSATGRNDFIRAFHGLKRRGLAEHNPMMAPGMGMPANMKPKWVYRLTPAGQHVLALLRLSGVAAAEPARPTPSRSETA